jgi:hypothetical protein
MPVSRSFMPRVTCCLSPRKAKRLTVDTTYSTGCVGTRFFVLRISHLLKWVGICICGKGTEQKGTDERSGAG